MALTVSRQLPSRKIVLRSGLGFGLGLDSVLGLVQFSSGAIVLEPALTHDLIAQSVRAFEKSTMESTLRIHFVCNKAYIQVFRIKSSACSTRGSSKTQECHQ